MKYRSLISKVSGLACLSGFLVSCKELPKEVEVSERRDLCQYDDVSVYKSRFDVFQVIQPLEWRRVSGTEFRLLNYVAGESVEVAVGQVNAGGVLANMNRWKGEFGQASLESLDGLEKIEMFGGSEAYVIQLKGTFTKKMSGMPVKADGWAVTGIICDTSDGASITIKMMGPEEEVMAEQDNLKEFAKNLRINELQTPDERSKKEKSVNKTEGGGY